MAELLPCPFCKGQNINIITCYDDACENVYCEGCDKVRYTIVCNAPRSGCGAICGWKATKEEIGEVLVLPVSDKVVQRLE